MNNIKKLLAQTKAQTSHWFNHCETGVTLVELLIVIIGLVVLAFVAVPMSKSLLSGDRSLNQANIEALNVKTAAINYQANTGKYPPDSDALWHDPSRPSDYLSSSPRAYYTIDIGTGKITGASTNSPGHLPSNPWSGIQWDQVTDSWAKQ